jgi:hypothetical protein
VEAVPHQNQTNKLNSSLLVHLFYGRNLEFHLHAGENGLLEGKRAFGKERLGVILERVTAVKA